MYDKEWAIDVYKRYIKITPREQQIKRVLAATALFYQQPFLNTIRIGQIIIASIQQRVDKAIWPLYKRLIKKSPYNPALAHKVSVKMSWAHYALLDSDRQMELFDRETT